MADNANLRKSLFPRLDPLRLASLLDKVHYFTILFILFVTSFYLFCCQPYTCHLLQKPFICIIAAYFPLRSPALHYILLSCTVLYCTHMWSFGLNILTDEVSYLLAVLIFSFEHKQVTPTPPSAVSSTSNLPLMEKKFLHAVVKKLKAQSRA